MPTGDRAGVKILVADDSDNERDTARSALISAGYHVEEAFDGQHALDVFARGETDLVMLDVAMPRLSGLEACRIIRARCQAVFLPIIIVSARGSVRAKVEGLRAGADDYLSKPYDVEELIARVEALLRARRSLRGEENPQHLLRVPSSARAVDRGHLRQMEEAFNRAARYSDPLACLSVVAEGVAEADVGAMIESSVRKSDIVLPSPQSGFLLLLPNTHFPGALAVAERIWRNARGEGVPVSVGVSFYPNRDTQSLEDLVDLVGLALEQAQKGGGKICLYQHQGYLYAPT